MQEHTLQVLEYHRFLDWVASFAGSAPGQEAVRALRPAAAADPDAWVPALTRDALACRRAGTELPTLHFEAPHAVLQRVAPADALLEVEDFLLVRRLLAAATTLRPLARPAESVRAPQLAALARELPPCADLAARLAAVFDDEGKVRDNASPALADLRRQIDASDRRILAHLHRLLQQGDYADVWQERFVALRNQRYVVPVRRERRARVRGVVHDQSNSGQTLYIEPDLTLEDGNELAALRLEERDELRRIFIALGDALRAASDDLLAAFAAFCRYDVAYAASAWANTFAAEYPTWGDRCSLVRAQHPLLQRRLHQEGRAGELVPLDLDLTPGLRVVAVTGANAGGKTVVLKTVGLLVLIAQTGLPIPVGAGTTLCFFPAVLADIGDEQSIEQNLSTFSGHQHRIAQLLRVASRGAALVLLDELGSGTDPVEGGALGCAILEALARYDGLTLATTHLGTIKNFVQARTDMVNASVLFDPETLQPLYRLLIGRPGASQALHIAERSGVAAQVVQRARELMGSDQAHLATVLATMDEKERRLRDDLDTARQARDEVLKERDSLRLELQTLRRQRRDLLHQAQDEAANLVENTRREMTRLLDEARQAGADGERGRATRRQVEERREKLRAGLAQTQPRPEQPLKPKALAIGDRVWVEPLRGKGRVTAISADRRRVTLDLDGITVTVESASLGRLSPEEQAAAATPVPGGGRGAGTAPTPVFREPVAMELNLIGLHVDQALPRLERFVDEAIYSGLEEVRIIHGMGTGALKQAVHAYLAKAPVRKFTLGVTGRDPGGPGATTVYL